MDVEELSSLFVTLSVDRIGEVMNCEQVQMMIQAAVAAALQQQQVQFDMKMEELNDAIQAETIKAPNVVEYQECELNFSDYSLDALKCVPEFSGNKKDYLTFRNAIIPRNIKYLKSSMVA